MHHSTITAAQSAAGLPIRAATSEAAVLALRTLRPFAVPLDAELDAQYGAGNWFVYWDEDLRGRPIRGTITLAYGTQTLIVG